MSEVNTVVFDLGNVFVRWNPRNYYRDVFRDDAKMEWFLANVCTHEWNLLLDSGVTYQEATQILKGQFPDWSHYIDQFESGWEKMFAGVIQGTVDILKDLKDRKVPVYAITNWSHQKFPRALELFPFFKWFDGVVVSGVEGLIKPDPKLFKLFLERYKLEASQCVFIDDLDVNVASANTLGFKGHVFTSPERLSEFLRYHQPLLASL